MNVKSLLQEIDDYSGKEKCALTIAESYIEGEESITEYVCAGDPIYLVLIAVNIIVEAADRLGFTAEELEPLIKKIRKGLTDKPIVS